MTAKEKIEVIEAFENGREIQCRAKGRRKWVDTESPTWDFCRIDYRVKPEPREPRVAWLHIFESGHFSAAYSEAEFAELKDPYLPQFFKFVEVIDDAE